VTLGSSHLLTLVMTLLLTLVMSCVFMRMGIHPTSAKETHMNIENLQDAITVTRHAQSDRDAQLVHLLEKMADRISQLEARLDRLSDLTVGSDEESFDEKVLQVLRVRSGSAREALEVLGSDCGFDSGVLSVIEENSYTVYTHIEAEIEEKMDSFSQSHAFAEAVAEAVQGSIVKIVEDVLSPELLHDAIIDTLGDPEDIVRKGLRSII
jgi:hypothetical protein